MKNNACKSNKLKLWEVSLLVGLIVAVVIAVFAQQEQQQLANSLIRLHVVANSDSEHDQQLKLLVRDRILMETDSMIESGNDVSTVRDKLKEKLSEIEEYARMELIEKGENYAVSATLDNEWFPTREYDGFKLPAGNYEALRVKIGEAAGKNWWCVVFPPLCTAAAKENFKDAASVNGMSVDQVKMISEDEVKYELKFKIVEIFGSAQGIFK